MNSWGNDSFERKIDKLLTDSVKSGAEPTGFRVDIMPARPKLPWVLMVSILVGAFILVVLGTQWLVSLNLDYSTGFSYEKVSGFVSEKVTVDVVFALAIILGLGGILLSFFPRNKRLLNHIM